MKKALGTLAILLSGAVCSDSNANNYWIEKQINQGQHFIGYDYVPSNITGWQIQSNDRYLVANFVGYQTDEMVLAIKPGSSYIMMHHTGSPHYKWWELYSGGNNFGGFWQTAANDLYVTGDFNGDGSDEILAANPSGYYRTLKIANSHPNYSWQSLQFATNGDIDAGDKLIAGDFDGDNIDETMLIKQNGSHYTMKFNTTTNNWDIIANGTAGTIFWWVINSNDKYTVGDFNNDGKDELLAVNPNGWHHTMAFQNGQWQFIEGNGSGSMGWWRIGAPDQYIAGDFDADGQTELLAMNPSNGWSHTMEFTNNSWQWRAGNGGSGKIGNWSMTANTKYAPRITTGYQDWLLAFDPNGYWGMMAFCNVGCPN